MAHGPTWDYLYGNRVAISTAFIAALTAATKTAPIPTPAIGKWIYDFFHQIFNITNTRLTDSPVITPPTNKEDAASDSQPHTS